MKKTILLIDDEQTILDSTSNLLEEYGYNVLAANSVQQSKEHLQANSNISLIMTDIEMPEEDGFAFLSYVNNNTHLKQIPVFVLSAFSDQEVVMKALSMGAKDYITKPFKYDILISKIEQKLAAALKNILLVSDNQSSVSFIDRTLRTEQFEIINAENGKDALDIMNKENISVVLLEIKLPDMSGFDLLTELKNISSDIPILYFVEKKSNYTLIDIIHKGGNGVIERPFNNKDIIKTFKELDKTPV